MRSSFNLKISYAHLLRPVSSKLLGTALRDPRYYRHRTTLLRARWTRDGERTLRAIESALNVQLPPVTMHAYVAPGFTPCSEPLIVNAQGSVVDTFDSLCHELIHVALSSALPTRDSFRRYIKVLGATFECQDHDTLIHLPVVAALEAVLRNLDPGERRIQRARVQARRQTNPATNNAWTILDRFGAEEILRTSRSAMHQR